MDTTHPVVTKGKYPDLIKLDFASMGLHPFILYGTQTWNPKNQLEDCHV